MIEELLNKRIFTLYIFPFIFGILSVFSFQPFNFTFINFLILPIIFYLIIFIKKNQKASLEKNLIKKIFLYLELFWFWILFRRITLDYKFINIR